MAEVKMSKEELRAIKNCGNMKNHSGFMGGGYGLAFVGAAVYYVQQSDGFWMGVLGVLKAIVWPAMLIYKVFTIIGM